MRAPDDDMATDQNNPTVVDTLWCNACRMNEAKIIGMKNYSSAWINGSTNHKTSCVVDHASCKCIQSYNILINYYDIDVRPCPNKTSVGLTHCQINL